MRRFFMIIMAVVVSAVVFSSCKSKFKSDFVDRLPGTWTLVSAYPEAATAYIGEGETITFEKDGKVELHTYASSMFKQIYWRYEADLERGESELYVYGEKQVEGDGETIYLFAGKIASSGEKYMKLQYTDDAYTTYSYEFVKQ